MAEGEKAWSLAEENRLLREELRAYREYDRLTGLYNQKTFYQKAAQLLADRPEEAFDIVCVDVERFKLVNDLYGPEVGDELLRHLAKEMREAFEPWGGLAARMSNDLFALCLPGGRRKAAEETILSIFRGCKLEMAVVPAIGFCPVTDRKQRVDSMCDWAILALKSIKGDYSRHAAVYDSGQRSLMLEEQELLNSMESALENGEFEVFIQPKCNMYSGRIVGGEALARWRHPTKGVIAPGAFIPLFERNGFIKRLDAYVWEETARWLRRWLDAGHEPLPISVNISRVDIYGMDVCGVLEGLLEKYGLDARLLELEITESAYVNQAGEVIRTMEKLMGLGFTVLIDDFGSGYSSLNMLTDVSVDVLKIDMRFLERDDRKSKGVLESVVHMGRWLNLPVIAEGVECRRQVDFLLGVGCVYAQGFYFYRPMPLADYEALLLDEDKTDDSNGGRLRVDHEALLDFHDLVHKDVMSDRLLGNLLGAIALYNFDGERLLLLKGTEEYYRLTGRRGQIREKGGWDMLAAIQEEDRPVALEGLKRAKEEAGESGVKVQVRQKLDGATHWIQIRLFHLAEKPDGDVFYGSISDVTDQMEAMERLRISEERFCLAMEATNIVLFELDVKTREARYSERAQKTFNLVATVANAPEGFIQQGTVCEESQADFRAIYDAIYRGEDRASRVIRARMGDGGLAWNRITLTAVKDQSGRTVRAVGTVETISRDSEPTPEIRLELDHQARRRPSGPPACARRR